MMPCCISLKPSGVIGERRQQPKYLKMWKIPLFELNYNQKETEAVTSVLDSAWLTMGGKTELFEEKFNEYLGGDTNTVAVTNCTAALHMSMILSDIGPGDEVIIPSLTFIADANAVALTGATPVPADCASLSDWNVTADTIAARITEKTKAVVIVHFAGFSCDMDPIVRLCKEQNLKLIEDVAHAPGATYKAQACGTFGDFGCFSFFSNKNLSTGEGGMLTVNDRKLYDTARLIRSHGMSAQTLSRHEGRAFSYDVVVPGLNYRIDEIRAALGLVQLEKLEAATRQRKQVFQWYREALDGTGVRLPFGAKNDGNDEAVYHILPALLPVGVNREGIMQSMKNQGIQTSIHYPAMNSFSAYKQFSSHSTPVSDEISLRELTLPLFPSLEHDDVKVVCQALEAAL